MCGTKLKDSNDMTPCLGGTSPNITSFDLQTPCELANTDY